MRSNAAESVSVAGDTPNYPVLIFLEGLTGFRQMNTFQVEELVSRGYIVVGIDQPGGAAAVFFPDGHHIAITGLVQQVLALNHQSVTPAAEPPQINGQAFKEGTIPYFAQDVSFALDQLVTINNADPKNILTGKLDLEHTGVFGVSMGGMVSAEACLKDPRLKACLVMDVTMTADVVQQGLRQPSMWITRPAETMRLERQKSGGWAEKDIEEHQTRMRAVYNITACQAMATSCRYPACSTLISLTFHLDHQSSRQLGSPGQLVSSGRMTSSMRTRSRSSTNSSKASLAPLLDGPAPQFPEVLVETRRPGVK